MKKIQMIFSLLTKKEKIQLSLIFLLMVFAGLLEVVGVGSISPFMSVVSKQEYINENIYLNSLYNYFNFLDKKSFTIFLGVLVIVFLTISNISRAAMSFITKYYSGKRLHSLSMRMLKKYLYQPYIFFLNQNTSNLSKNILSEASIYVTGVLVIFLQLITNIVISISIFSVLVIKNPIVALSVSSFIGLFYVLIFSSVRNFINRKGKERAKDNSLKYKYVSEAFSGIKDVKLMGNEDVFIEQFSEPSSRFAMNNAVSDVIGDMPKYLLETIGFGGIIGYILFMLLKGENIGSFLPILTLYAFGGYRLLPALQKVFNAFSKIKYNYPIVELLFNEYNKLPDFDRDRKSDEQKTLELKKEIVIKNLSFQYPNTREPLIYNQSLKITANTSVGFVGPTGCGKTTMIDIILGLLEPHSGKIFVDDLEIQDNNRRAWQKTLGYVPQGIYLIDDTIKRNIAFGIPEDKIDFKSVKNAAEIANLHDFIENDLEEKYNTIVGERGIRLSGGQKQRIGIARAVYSNPSILIMDEATSALDGLTEQAIMDAIHNLSHKKTIIMIAHRLTTVKECDVIHIMDKGCIIDSGNYKELVRRNERFRRMAEGE